MNPRFLNAQIDEAGAIQYLLKYGKIVELAKSIVSNGGLYVGERIVAVKNNNDDDTYTVLEGNRRTCACKLLLNPDLIPDGYKNIFPIAHYEVIKNISNIEIDIVNNREEVARYLADRHIESVLFWSPLAKMKFFVDRFEAGETVQSIAATTHTNVSKVKKGIREYKLLNYALNLSCWTDKQRREKLNVFNLEIDKFLRIFRTAGASRAFGLLYDNSFNPQSSLGREIFDKIVERIMYCAFITENNDEKIDTRTNSWRDVPGLINILESTNIIINNSQEDPRINNEQSSNLNLHQPPTEGSALLLQEHENTSNSQTASQIINQTVTGQNQVGVHVRPAQPTYYRDNLIPRTCVLNITNPKIHNIYSELQRLNLNYYPNSCAIIFRVFFDLTIEEYVRRHNLQVQGRASLSDKFNSVLQHLEENGLLALRDANALRQITSQNPLQQPTILSITNFHDYVHRLNYQPTARELTIIWDNLQHLMQIIYQ
jgi:hypothetical protein